MRIVLSLLAFSTHLFLSPVHADPLPPGALNVRPKLVLVLVVDQFRGDYLTRFKSRFLPAQGKNGEVGGFSYLLSQGAWFPHGEYEMLQDMTGPGHATILTGAYPYQNGVPLNDWYETKRNAHVYCAEDAEYETVGAETAPHVGSSPRNMRGSTVGDELKNAGHPSRVVSIAVKDRASIFMGGHRADLALWIDPKTFRWVSSRYYLPKGKLPDWVERLNEKLSEAKSKKKSWVASGPASLTVTDNSTALLGENTKKSFQTDFPHTIDMGRKESLASPYGLEITDDAAIAAIDAFGLGKGKSVDLLAVSYSSHDYLGHEFGPNSREMEEMTVADDAAIARLLNQVRVKVPGGLKNVLIVLTGDHGVAPNPDWLSANKMKAGRLDEGKIMERLESALAERFGKPGNGKYLSFGLELNYYLDERALTDRKVAKADAEGVLKETLLKEPGVAQVVTGTESEARRYPPALLGQQVMKTYVPGRSGNAIAILEPFYFAGAVTTTHLTGLSYDRTVPILLAGPLIRPGVYSSQARVVDIAPTLAFFLGTIPPALSEGRVLNEIVASTQKR